MHCYSKLLQRVNKLEFTRVSSMSLNICMIEQFQYWPRRKVTESTAPSANIAHNHKGSGSITKAFEELEACYSLANLVLLVSRRLSPAMTGLHLGLLDGICFDTAFEELKGPDIECISLFEVVNFFWQRVTRSRLNSCSIYKV